MNATSFVQGQILCHALRPTRPRDAVRPRIEVTRGPPSGVARGCSRSHWGLYNRMAPATVKQAELYEMYGRGVVWPLVSSTPPPLSGAPAAMEAVAAALFRQGAAGAGGVAPGVRRFYDEEPCRSLTRWAPSLPDATGWSA